FFDVAGWGRGAVRVDVVDRRSVELGVAQGLAHRACAASAARGRLGDVVGVAGGGITDELGEDVGTTLLGACESLQNDGARAFAADEAVARLVPRAARLRRLVVAAAEGEHGAEAADTNGRNRRFGAAGHHDLGA